MYVRPSPPLLLCVPSCQVKKPALKMLQVEEKMRSCDTPPPITPANSQAKYERGHSGPADLLTNHKSKCGPSPCCTEQRESS